MYRLLYYKLKHSFLSAKLLSVVIVLSVTASLFCLNVMLGYAEDLYQSSYNASWYSTICITGIDSDAYAEIEHYMIESRMCKIGSTLAFSETEQGIVIGWKGSDPPYRWFPHMSGRFFTESDLAQSQNIAYLSRDLYESNMREPYIEVNGIKYEIIGYGWVIRYNFLRSIGSNSSQTVLPTSTSADGHTRNLFMLLPHLTYKQHGYIPEMYLVHVDDMSHSQLKALTADLQKQFPYAEFVQSDQNSSTMRTIEKLRYVPFGVAFAAMIGVSLIQMFTAWFEETKHLVFTYTVCGMSRKKMWMLMLMEILIFVLIGESLALILQWMLLPFLSHIGVSYMPVAMDVVVISVIAFLMLILLMNKRMRKAIRVERGERS